MAGCDRVPLDVGTTDSLGAADASSPTFPPVTDFAARGPFDTRVDVSDARCKVFRPTTLGAGGVKHPVILWGNGTLGFPAVYTGILDHWASHGFVVAAANTSNAGTGEEMLACLEWVLAENARAGSPYFGKVDVAHVGASGHSQGGGGAIMVGRDPRVVATAPLMPYTLGLGHDATSQSQQHGPMLLLSGGNDSIAPAPKNQAPVFAATNVPVFWGTLETADHVRGLGDTGKFRGPLIAWFRLELMGDENARAMFYGPTCTLCVDRTWTVQRRGIP